MRLIRNRSNFREWWVAGMGLALCLPLLTASTATGADEDGDSGKTSKIADRYRKPIEDWRIEAAVEAQLMKTDAVNAHDIDVHVTEGIVTLGGEVDSLMAWERAARSASLIKGVRAVVNRIKTSPSDLTDTEIRAAVDAALLRDPATDSWEIDVQVEDGIVTLEGNVTSFAEKTLACQVAKTVHGVRALADAIQVDYSDMRTDAEILAEIERRLEWDDRIDDQLIAVKVDDGDVTLAGSVGSAYEKVLARSDAWVAGVKSVTSDGLDVEWWKRDLMVRRRPLTDLSDREIEEAILKAFQYDPRVLSFQPEVRVEDGVVTLRGVVDNLEARRAADDDARNTLGVWRVRNHLKVRPLAKRPDDAVENDVEAALHRDSLVNGLDIDVMVIDGRAILTGTVDSLPERQQAENVAAKVRGVKIVRNHLAVDPVPLPDLVTSLDWPPTTNPLYEYRTVRVRPDRMIRQDIESELWWSPFVDEDEVEVKDGVATLTGTVDSWSERRAAAVNALEAGAHKVVNKLTVQTQ